MVQQRFRITAFLAAAVPAILLGVGFAAPPNERGERVETGPDNSHRLALAEKTPAVAPVYTKFCLACHGADGKGTTVKPAMPTIPDFTSRKWQDGLSNVQLKVSILEGKGTFMPPFRDKVSDEENNDLAASVRGFATK